MESFHSAQENLLDNNLQFPRAIKECDFCTGELIELFIYQVLEILDSRHIEILYNLISVF